MGNSADFAPYPLWLASYGVSKPAVVGGWKSYTFWQYTETGKLAGAGPKTDLSVFTGSLAQLETMTTTTASPAAAAAAADAMTLKYTTRVTPKPADATRGAVTSSRSDLRLWLGAFGMDGSRTIAGH
jgi:Glycosyl hydrolases family 25